MNRFFSIIILIFISSNLIAQQEIGTHFMRDIWQSNLTNPAFIPEDKITISLPGIYYDFYHSGGGYNDIIDASGEVARINFNQLLSQLEDENNLNSYLDVPTIGVAWKKDKLLLSFGHRIRLNSRLDYNNILPKLLAQGNAQHIGETVSFAPAINLMSWHEIAVGAAYDIGKLSIGGKLKYLNGLGNIQTTNAQASLYTDPDVYQLTFNTNYQINASAFLDINDITDINLNTNISENLFTSNQGIAFDIGVEYKVNDQLSLAASILDIGQIKWSDNAFNYKSQGSYTYDGINLNDFITNGSVGFDVKLDTIQEIFEFDRQAASYTTPIPTQIYLSGNYQLNEKVQLGMLYQMIRFENESQSAFAIHANTQIGKILRIGGVYSFRNNDFLNLGLNFVVNVGPVQLFAMTDNIIGLAQLNDSNNVNGRTGLNIKF